MAKATSIRPVVLMLYRLVTDGRTDRHMTTAYTVLGVLYPPTVADELLILISLSHVCCF